MRRVRVGKNAYQVIGTGVVAAVTWTHELVDTDTMFTTGSNTRLTFTTAGLYLVTASLVVGTQEAANYRARWRLNGATFVTDDDMLPKAGLYWTWQIGFPFVAAAADYLEIVCETNTQNLVVYHGSTAEAYSLS